MVLWTGKYLLLRLLFNCDDNECIFVLFDQFLFSYYFHRVE
jgi:hypothetical protein